MTLDDALELLLIALYVVSLIYCMAAALLLPFGVHLSM